MLQRLTWPVVLVSHWVFVKKKKKWGNMMPLYINTVLLIAVTLNTGYNAPSCEATVLYVALLFCINHLLKMQHFSDFVKLLVWFCFEVTLTFNAQKTLAAFSRQFHKIKAIFSSFVRSAIVIRRWFYWVLDPRNKWMVQYGSFNKVGFCEKL